VINVALNGENVNNFINKFILYPNMITYYGVPFIPLIGLVIVLEQEQQAVFNRGLKKNKQQGTRITCQTPQLSMRQEKFQI
jgi:hypothetical protein